MSKKYAATITVTYLIDFEEYGEMDLKDQARDKAIENLSFNDWDELQVSRVSEI